MTGGPLLLQEPLASSGPLRWDRQGLAQAQALTPQVLVPHEPGP